MFLEHVVLESETEFLHKLTLFVGVFLKLDSLLESLLLSYSRSIFVIVVL